MSDVRCPPSDVPVRRLLAPSNQPRPELIGEIRVRPLDQNSQAVSEPRQVHEVDEEPEEPRRLAPDLERGKLGNRAMAADGGKVALVPVMKRPGVSPLNAAQDVVGGP